MITTFYRKFYVSDAVNIPLFIWIRHHYLNYLDGLRVDFMEIIELEATIKELLIFMFMLLFMPITLALIPPVAIWYRKNCTQEKYHNKFHTFYHTYMIDKKYIKRSVPFRVGK